MGRQRARLNPGKATLVARGRRAFSLLLLGYLFLGCDAPPSYIPPEIMLNPPSLPGGHISAPGLDEEINGHEWIKTVLFGATNRSDPRLPNYAYFQGLLQAKNHVIVAGQVRIVGGILGADNGVAALYAGAMATTNPYAFTNAGPLMTGGPDGIRTRVGHWEEIPTPP